MIRAEQIWDISIHALREEGDHKSKSKQAPAAIFLSTPSARRATRPLRLHPPHTHISIHALREEGDEVYFHFFDFVQYFYPRPPRGGRRKANRSRRTREEFLSTPSARRATSVTPYNGNMFTFLSTPSARRATAASSISSAKVLHFYPRPPRGGRPFNEIHKTKMTYISIHALREEGDLHLDFCCFCFFSISIHALREEGDVSSTGKRITRNRFLSTPSARRAT